MIKCPVAAGSKRAGGRRGGLRAGVARMNRSRVPSQLYPSPSQSWPSFVYGNAHEPAWPRAAKSGRVEDGRGGLGLWPSPARIGAEAIVLRQKWSRGQVEARLANLPPCLIGMEACVGAHHLSRKLQLFE